jgi:uncharacterized protein (TIGR00290 family)
MRSICSWSGGKDSVLALQLAMDQGATPVALFTMLDESGKRSRSHGLPLHILEAQASALGLPLITRSATWDNYTDRFIEGLKQCVLAGGEACLFGDIDIESHRQWCEAACVAAGISASLPLWQRPRRELLAEFLQRGYTARIVVVRNTKMSPIFLGRRLDQGLVAELEVLEVDACGENGEYHTVVTDGPLFSKAIRLTGVGELAVADCTLLQLELVGDGTGRELEG